MIDNSNLYPIVFKIIVYLTVMVIGLLIVVYFKKRFIKKGSWRNNNKLIQVLENHYIGIKKSIALVKIPGTILVLGITNDDINCLTKIENQDIIDGIEKDNREYEGKSFSEQLHSLSTKLKIKKRLS